MEGSAPDGGSQTNDRTPVLTLHPVFVPSQQIFGRLPIVLALGTWGTFFLGGWTSHWLGLAHQGAGGWIALAAIGPLLALGVGGAGYLWDRRTYADASYRFHPDVLEIVEGSKRTVLPLASITEVELQRSVGQARRGLGTILLSRPARPVGGRVAAHLRLPDLDRAEEVRGRILELVEEAKYGRPLRTGTESGTFFNHSCDRDLARRPPTSRMVEKRA